MSAIYESTDDYVLILSDESLEMLAAENLRWTRISRTHEILAASAGGLLVGWILVVAAQSIWV